MQRYFQLKQQAASGRHMPASDAAALQSLMLERKALEWWFRLMQTASFVGLLTPEQLYGIGVPSHCIARGLGLRSLAVPLPLSWSAKVTRGACGNMPISGAQACLTWLLLSDDTSASESLSSAYRISQRMLLHLISVPVAVVPMIVVVIVALRFAW